MNLAPIESLFVDTWGWLALADASEEFHTEVSSYFRESVETGGTIYTTDFVLDETITLLYSRLDAESARTMMDRLLVWRDMDVIDVILVNETVFQHTVALRRRYYDKPDISFTDLSSMAVMDELGITDVLTGDAHFEHVGMGFRRRP